MLPLTKLIAVMRITALLALTAQNVSADEPVAKHLFILSGQSNMRQPLIGTFMDTVKKVLGDDKVLFASHGHPGQPIRSWYRNWTPPPGMEKPESNTAVYDKLLSSVRKSIQNQKIDTVTLIWMQGEEDARMGYGSVYEQSFWGLIDQLKADLGIQEINFVLGRINDYWLPNRDIVDGEMMRALQPKIAEARENGAWINTDDLNTGVNPWGTYEIDGGHFTNAGYRVMGLRFARQACKLAAPTVVPNEALFVETFLDDAHKVKSHLALNKLITGTNANPNPAAGNSGLAALVDGKFGAANHRNPEWLGFAPAEQPIELTIDLGQVSNITSVALNLLNDPLGAAYFPHKIDVSISENGTDFQHFMKGRSNELSFSKQAREQNLAKDFSPRASFIFIESDPTAGRYVKFTITPDTASKAWVFLDEIFINPAQL